MKIIVNYQKHWGDDGTVYKQTIKIDKELQEKYNSELQKEYDRIEEREKAEHLLEYRDIQIKAYTKKLEKGVNFLHLIGLQRFIDLAFENKVEKKERILRRNTIIEVI